MFIYLDETHNLIRGSKNQFLGIAGFATSNPNDSVKAFKRLKKKGLPKNAYNKEIKSTNALSERYILPKLLSDEHKIMDLKVGIVIQQKSNLKHIYFSKGKLNYDHLYLDLVKFLLINGWKYADKDIVIITFDTFTTKKINKENIAKIIRSELEEHYPKVNFNVRFATSELENLQLADQFCGIAHKQFSTNNKYLLLLKKTYEVREFINPFSS